MGCYQYLVLVQYVYSNKGLLDSSTTDVTTLFQLQDMVPGTAKYRKRRWLISLYHPELTHDRLATLTSISHGSQ